LAKAVIEAFEAAGNPGVVGLDGQMYDRPHLERAKKLLARSEKYT
jgi:citrate lyase subunit beta/citryl-CoA lyase